jgi:hypothetical protein
MTGCKARRILLGVSLMVALISSGVWTALAVENGGAAQLLLDGGNRGTVAFPHHRHQNVLQDCMICHALFPQEAGIIARLKQEGKLVKKQVMTKHCIRCHKERKRQGNTSGPTKCSNCHLKKK